MKHIFTIFLLAFILLFASCDRVECENTNPVFNEYNYFDKEYKTELASQIKTIGLKNLRTWLADYVEKDGYTYLVFYIQNENLCAEVIVKMNHWDKLENLKAKKGKGRFNAEFLDFEFVTEKNIDGNIEFVYQTFDRIID